MNRPRATFLVVVLCLTGACRQDTERPGAAAPPPDAGVSDGPRKTDARPDGARAVDAPFEDDAAGPVRPDCYPACIANLRRQCRRAVPGDGGVCIGGFADGLQTYCFPNGVRELRRSADGGGGSSAVFTYPDGTTPCYLVDVIPPVSGASGGVLVYRTPDGREVARVTFATDGIDRTVTCDGQTYRLTAAMAGDPACREGNETDCRRGVCPPLTGADAGGLAPARAR